MIEELDALARALGLDFRDRSLLFQSLVHRSYLNENPGTRLRSNERLEFLGDAILDAVAAEFLFQRCPEEGEGDLTLWRSALVRTETLATFAVQFDLGRYLVMGRGEEADGGRTRTTILADAFEAVLGAVYLDGGLDAVRAFLTPFLEKALEGFAGQLPVDYKSTLQIEAQGRVGITPQYRTAASWGPDHARTFQVEAWVGERLLGRGEGLSKQAAQQEAARAALEQLQAGDAAPAGEVEHGDAPGDQEQRQDAQASGAEEHEHAPAPQLPPEDVA
jgi:ribonuclease-3